MSTLNLKPIIINNNFKMNDHKGMVDYLVRSESSLQKMIDKSNADVLMALQNLRTATLLNENLPCVNEKLYAELIDTVTLDKKRPLNLIYDERLKKLTFTQEKIYKVLAKIEEDLIDEQDTSIKDNSRPINYTLLAKKIIEHEEKLVNEIYKQSEGNSNGSSSNDSSNGSNGIPNVSNVAQNLLATAGIAGAVAVRRGKVPTGKPPAPSGKPAGKVKFTKFFKYAGKAIAPLKLILLVYDFGKYLDIANDTIEDSGCIERFIFATAGAVSDFIHFEYELLNMLVNGLDKLIKFIDENLASLLDSDEIQSNEKSSITSFFKTIAPKIVYLDGGLFSKFVTHILKPVMDYCNKNAKWGVDAGYLAVEMYRNMKERLMAEVPNGTTFELIFGTNKDLEESISSGLYTWHTWGTSDLIGDAESIAKLMTKSELSAIAEHNDLDDFTKDKLKKAMSLKDSEEYSDIKTIELRNTKVNYQHILNALEKNSNVMGKIWYELIFKCKEYAKVKPENCIIEGHWNNGKFESFTVPNVFAPSSALDSTDKAKEFNNILIKHLVRTGFNLQKETERDEIWFTIYGTVVQSYNVFDVIRFENLVREGMKKPHRGAMASRINKVLGYLDPETLKIKDHMVAPNDTVFEKVFDSNIITKSEVNNETKVLSSENFKYGMNGMNDISMTDEKANTSITPQIPSIPEPKLSSVARVSTKKVPINEVSKIVWKKLMSYGFTKEQTAGIMGNMMQESTMRPWIKNSIGAFGLCQWLGVRYKALVKFANGRDLNDPALQIDFLMHELNTTEKRAFEHLKKARTIEEATWAWVKYFERPGKHEYFTEKRIGYAQGFYNSQSDTPIDSSVTTPSMDFSQNAVSTASNNVISSDSLKYGNTGIQMVNTNVGNTGSSGASVNASRYARSHAHKKSKGYCARYVANALQASGFKFQRQPSAYMYHTNGVLSRMGFRLVHSGINGFRPQIGDVCVINRFGKHIHGHICIWDGRNWISDFVQRTASPYLAGAPAGAWYYRYGNNVEISNSEMANSMDTQTVSVSSSGMSEYAGDSVSEDSSRKAKGNFEVNNSKGTEPITHFGESENLFLIGYQFCMA